MGDGVLKSNRAIFPQECAEFLTKPIGASSYRLTRALPGEIRGSLPSVKELERELAE